MREEIKPSVLTIEQQSKISMSGVSSVDAFSDGEIKLTVNGNRVIISGSRLKVLSFSEGSGNFMASGEVTNVRFGAKVGALKRLLR